MLGICEAVAFVVSSMFCIRNSESREDALVA